MGERGDRSLAYAPALDGVRALAVAAVLAFHSGYGWASGGFLGVSLFFTLSGYLITSLLLVERARRGSVSLGNFWARRARRLLPAALLCVALVLAVAVWWTPSQRDHLPGDAIASVLGVANWRFIGLDASYRDLFLGAPSPLAHFWSLAVEQQCYLVLPLLVAGLLRFGRRVTGLVLAALALAAGVAAVLITDTDLAYQGTFTRAAELLAGAVLAVVLATRRPSPRAAGWMAGAGLAAFAAAVTGLSLEDTWLYHGGLAASGVVWAVLLAGLALQTGTMVSRAVGWAPLAAIGRVSYGLYLFHWPVFLLITPQRLGAGGVPLLLTRLAATTAVTLASYHLLERPVRNGAVWRGRRGALAVPLAMGAVVAAALLVVPAPGYSRTEQLLAAGDGGPVDLGASAGGAAGDGATAATPERTDPPRPVVLVIGSAAPPELDTTQWDVHDATQPECPLVPGVELRLGDGAVVPTAACVPLRRQLPDLLATHHPDAIVLVVAAFDAAAVRFADQPTFPRTDDLVAVAASLRRVEEEVRRTLEDVVQAGVTVVVYNAEPRAHSADRIQTAMLRVGLFGEIATTPAELVAGLAAAAGQPAATAPTILVLGDSTSLDVAQALQDGADDRLRVVWAGRNGCPFAAVEAVRSYPSDAWHPTNCPDLTAAVPTLVDTYHPTAVLLVVGPTELTEQQFNVGGEAAVAGDEAFTAAHDQAMQELLDLLPAGTPVIVADSPQIAQGMWASPEMADPARLAAWNAQVERWAAAHPGDVVVWHYAAALEAYEAEHGSTRSDGVHPEVEALTDLARTTLVDQVLALLPPRS